MGDRVWERRRREARGYRRREPSGNGLYRIVYQERERLEREWESRFQERYGCLRREVLGTLDKYLNCGILAHGCARAVCESRSCGHSILIPFSCKKRICPSCAAKRALIFGDHLHEEVLAPVPHRHLVLSLPKRLRGFFRYDRSLNKILFKAGWGSLKALFEALLPGSPGAVLVLQTAGESLNFNPHLHCCVTDGSIDEEGNFHPLGSMDTEKLCTLFAHKVLRALKKRKLITDKIIQQIKSQKYTGFSAWWGEQIKPDDESYRLFLAGYIDRGAVAESRIEIQDDIITYRTDKDEKTHEFEALEFLARLTPHIALKWESTVRYVGYYSHRLRGERGKKLESDNPSLNILPLPEDRKQVASRTWAALIKRVFELDPLLCPRCGGTMRIRSFITDPKQIARLLANLNITPFTKPEPIRATGPPGEVTEQIVEPYFDDLEFAI